MKFQTRNSEEFSTSQINKVHNFMYSCIFKWNLSLLPYRYQSGWDDFSIEIILLVYLL
jgi:hypothetical protein